jgi:hypothetical protein
MTDASDLADSAVAMKLQPNIRLKEQAWLHNIKILNNFDELQSIL